MALLGELDGQHVDASTDFSQSVFQQLTLPYSLDLSTGNLLHLEWNEFLSKGAVTAASGTVAMPAGVAPHAGETICGAAGTFKYRDAAGGASDYIFTLTDLSLGPSCPGTSLAGSLAGCAEPLPPF
jgi:hypothetical protein